jgi:hypothetical protein
MGEQPYFSSEPPKALDQYYNVGRVDSEQLKLLSDARTIMTLSGLADADVGWGKWQSCALGLPSKAVKKALVLIYLACNGEILGTGGAKSRTIVMSLYCPVGQSSQETGAPGWAGGTVKSSIQIGGYMPLNVDDWFRAENEVMVVADVRNDNLYYKLEKKMYNENAVEAVWDDAAVAIAGVCLNIKVLGYCEALTTLAL